MNTRSLGLSTLLVSLALTAADATAQSLRELKKELKTREAKVANDLDGLVELAKWARGKDLARDAKRLLEAALDIDPEHEGARVELGFVKFDDEWVTTAKAEVLRAKAADAAMKAKGMVKVSGVWVAKDKTKDAKKGVFWHLGERVSLVEKQALSMGKVRHPRTGAFIPGEELARAEDGLFRGQDGKWMTLTQADKYHADLDHPWVVRTKSATIVSTLSLAKVEGFKVEVENGVDTAKKVFLGQVPGGKHRPVVLIARDLDSYREIGSTIGDSGSAYGSFFAINALNIPHLGEVFPAVCHDDADWGPYLVRHAAGLAVARGIIDPSEIRAPDWFARGVGALAERFRVPAHASYFAKQHVGKGGIKDLKTWFNSFAIDGGMDSKRVGYNIFQAGLVLDYAMKGGDDDCLEAMERVSKAVTEKPKNAKKAFKKFVKRLAKNEDELREYLRSLAK